MNSVVDVTGIDEKVPDRRPMQGQSPFIVNGGLSYVDLKNNFSVTGMLNWVGHRIFIVGSNIIPNRWERPTTVVDLQLTKSFYKNRFEVRFNVRDLLHQNLVYYYKGTDRKSNRYDRSVDYLNFDRTYGTTYSVVLGFKF
jgi:hypothetical protein